MKYIDPRTRDKLIAEAPETDKIMADALETWFADKEMELYTLRGEYDKAHDIETVKTGYWIDDAYSDHTDRDIAEIIKTDSAQDPPVNMTHPDWSKKPVHRYADVGAGSDLCRSCIEEVLDRIMTLRRARAEAQGIPEGSLAEIVLEDDIYMSVHSGGSDNTMHCDVCGQILDCSLTEDGLAQELEHYKNHESQAPVENEVLQPWVIGTIYNLEQLAETAKYLGVLHVETMLEVKGLLERADNVALIDAVKARIAQKEQA